MLVPEQPGYCLTLRHARSARSRYQCPPASTLINSFPPHYATDSSSPVVDQTYSHRSLAARTDRSMPAHLCVLGRRLGGRGLHLSRSVLPQHAPLRHTATHEDVLYDVHDTTSIASIPLAPCTSRDKHPARHTPPCEVPASRTLAPRPLMRRCLHNGGPHPNTVDATRSPRQRRPPSDIQIDRSILMYTRPGPRLPRRR
jgi:hypothetical protein